MKYLLIIIAAVIALAATVMFMRGMAWDKTFAKNADVTATPVAEFKQRLEQDQCVVFYQYADIGVCR